MVNFLGIKIIRGKPKGVFHKASTNDTSLRVLTVATTLLTTTSWTDGASIQCEASATNALIVATPTNAGATVTYTDNINGLDVDGHVTIASGANTITVTVKAADGIATKTYTLTLDASSVAPDYTLVNPILDNTTPTAGDLITCYANDTGSGATSFNYSWSNGSAIGIGASTYTAQRSDMGLAITCTVTPVNAWGSGTPVETSATSLVTAVTLCTIAPAITTDGAGGGSGDTAFVSDNVSTTDGTWTGYPTPTLVGYAWISTSTGAPVGTSSSYLIVSGDNPGNIHSLVTFNNGIGGDISRSSNTLTVSALSAPSYGTLLQTICIGYDSYNQYADGMWGFYNVLVEANSVSCGYVAPLPGGTLITTYCDGLDYYGTYADGSNGSYNALIESNSASCGYAPPPAYGTLLSNYCAGYDYYGTYADGSGATYDALIESNSASCGF